MRENANKEKVLSKMAECQKEFGKNLKNKKILFLLQNKNKTLSTQEVFFPKSAFLHLTGYNVYRKEDEKKLNSYEFYDLLDDNKLNTELYLFKRKDNSSDLKLRVLPEIMKIDKNAKMIGFYDKSRIYLQTDKIVGSISACMGIVKAENYKFNYIPNTVLNEDIRNITNERSRVIAIFKKDYLEEYYWNVTYLNRSMSIRDLSKIKELHKFVNFEKIYSDVIEIKRKIVAYEVDYK